MPDPAPSPNGSGAAGNRAPRARSGPRISSWHWLVILAAIAGVLVLVNNFTTAGDIRLATGPASPAQKAFFVTASERPDLVLFYQTKMNSVQRVAMAQRIGEHRAPELAKLIGRLLESFDEQARAELTKSLTALAADETEAVSKELDKGAAFQRIGVFAALRAQGDRAIPFVVKQLSDGGRRANAVSFLVDYGAAAVPEILPILDSEDKDTRLAAADALGKLRARAAVPKLLELYEEALEVDRLSYLTALATIADPATEGFLLRALEDPNLPNPNRAQAALGLGRIGSEAAIAALYGQLQVVDRDYRQAVLDGLSAAGPRAIRPEKVTSRDAFEIAAGIPGERADAVLRSGLNATERSDRLHAIRLSANRPALAGDLAALIGRLDPNQDGDLIDAALTSLTSTPVGEARLASLRGLPGMDGFLARL